MRPINQAKADVLQYMFDVAKELEESMAPRGITTVDLLRRLDVLGDPRTNDTQTRRDVRWVFDGALYRDYWRKIGTAAFRDVGRSARTIYVQADRDVTTIDALHARDAVYGGLPDPCTIAETASVAPKPTASMLRRTLHTLNSAYRFAVVNGYKISAQDMKSIEKSMTWLQGVCGGETWQQ